MHIFKRLTDQLIHRAVASYFGTLFAMKTTITCCTGKIKLSWDSPELKLPGMLLPEA